MFAKQSNGNNQMTNLLTVAEYAAKCNVRTGTIYERLKRNSLTPTNVDLPGGGVQVMIDPAINPPVKANTGRKRKDPRNV